MDSGGHRFTHINFQSLCLVIAISTYHFLPSILPLFLYMTFPTPPVISIFLIHFCCSFFRCPFCISVRSQLPSLSIHAYFHPCWLPAWIFLCKPLSMSQCLCQICLADCSGLHFWSQPAPSPEVHFGAGIWYTADSSPNLLPSTYFSFDPNCHLTVSSLVHLLVFYVLFLRPHSAYLSPVLSLIPQTSLPYFFYFWQRTFCTGGTCCSCFPTAISSQCIAQWQTAAKE